ncbi:Hypothetical predicted protein [Olea europaea subsp. europaea]|uniref:Uncharacterized protein n=1 Tax=Olea europaea subsp. europaea TaxID=158383 RepID=A0A8S0PAL1_OLEEU|nr:Hypothetical predicted protein [Olea europaea subsp. europaea]
MLNPIDDELLEPFWKESGPFDDEANPKLDNVASKDEARRPPPSYDSIAHIIKQEIRGVEERLRGEMSEHFDRVERKIDLFLQLAGRGGVQSERSEFDDRAFNIDNQQKKEARERDEVIIEECSHEEVTSNKQPKAFPTYDDRFVPDPSFAIVLYQQQPLVWTRETFRTEEGRQDDVIEKWLGQKMIQTYLTKEGGIELREEQSCCFLHTLNPLKRRKLLNIQAYDPLREVDPAKVEDINKWLANASTR